jgi:hypothetical protein
MRMRRELEDLQRSAESINYNSRKRNAASLDNDSGHQMNHEVHPATTTPPVSESEDEQEFTSSSEDDDVDSEEEKEATVKRTGRRKYIIDNKKVTLIGGIITTAHNKTAAVFKSPAGSNISAYLRQADMRRTRTILAWRQKCATAAKAGHVTNMMCKYTRPGLDPELPISSRACPMLLLSIEIIKRICDTPDDELTAEEKHIGKSISLSDAREILETLYPSRRTDEHAEHHTSTRNKRPRLQASAHSADISAATAEAASAMHNLARFCRPSADAAFARIVEANED